MRLPKRTVNPGLAALIQGAGFRSFERFAVAVNARGWETFGVKLSYDHISVKRWLTGSVCQNPEVVAAVLSDAWGIPVPIQVIWPELRDGQGPVPAHLQAWVMTRTLEDLGTFIGSDMLTRREVLAGSIGVVTGPALVDPVARWLSVASGGVPAQGEGAQRIGAGEVEGIELATRRFASLDAEVGGGLSREAAVGQLKYAVDLVRYSSYSDVVGNRLLAAVAELAGVVGWMCQDSGMSGPAQRYLLYGLHAAKESSDPRAPLLVIGILRDLARHAHWTGDPGTALRVLDVAIDQLPGERGRLGSLRAVLWSNKAWALASLGKPGVPEARNALGLAADLREHASDDDRVTALGVLHELPDARPEVLDAQLAITASCAYLTMAEHDVQTAVEAQTRALAAVAESVDQPGRHGLMAQIRLARTRFAAGEPEQGCVDGDEALARLNGSVSTMVTARLRELAGNTEPYRAVPAVREFREQLGSCLAGSRRAPRPKS